MSTRYFIEFDYESVQELEQVAEHVQRSYSGKAANLYIHTGMKGEFYQATRRCTCGSHIFEDAHTDTQRKVNCLKCGTSYDVQ